MTTNLPIKKETELFKKAEALLKAAHDYWEEYRKEGGFGAVVWVEAASGHFVLFTRSEYKRSITSVIDNIAGEPLDRPFEKPEATENKVSVKDVTITP